MKLTISKLLPILLSLVLAAGVASCGDDAADDDTSAADDDTSAADDDTSAGDDDTGAAGDCDTFATVDCSAACTNYASICDDAECADDGSCGDVTEADCVTGCTASTTAGVAMPDTVNVVWGCMAANGSCVDYAACVSTRCPGM